MVGIMPLLRRCDANSRSNVRPATGVPDHRAANSEKEATLTKQANDFRGRIFSREDIFARGYFREKIFSREDIFAGRYFRVNSIFAKISSRENISNSLFAKFSSRENKVLYSRAYAVSVSGMRYALSGNNGKACKRTRVDLSCGCEWLRMRKTESLQVAIHEAKGYEIRWRKLGYP